MTTPSSWWHGRAAGTSLLLGRPAGTDSPVVLHWGRDLGELEGRDIDGLMAAHAPTVTHSSVDAPRHLGLVPQTTTGFTGTPGVEGFRPAGGSVVPRFADWSLDADGGTVVLRSTDDEAGLRVEVTMRVTEEGIVEASTALVNVGDGDFVVQAVRCVLPVASVATELLDLTGRWSGERAPQRHDWKHGTWTRAGRHGRTGHDATLVLVAGTTGFGFRGGEVWAVHSAWSGDHVHYAERTPEGEALLGAHELLGAGEVVLGPGEDYTSPVLLGSWSDAGLDGMSARFHAWTRRHSPRSRSPRPVVVNTWEAVYFDHDLDRLTALVDAAAEVGAERFVLDDGWFTGRRGDTAGLGDWTVDPAVWPDGLHPLVEHVHRRGLDFGLWVEPEMVNVDSDLAREHPDWLLRGRSALPPEWRHQQVLDLQQPAAYAHVRDALAALLEEYPIAFLKWDHNRDLIDVAHGDRPAVHGQTLALYRLLDELRDRHPRLEVESCASGGGRVDLGILQRTDRIWASDTNDALERQHIQRWTGLLVPPEIVGAHVGGPVAHTTGRSHRLGYRAATALLGHFGVEWDLTRTSGEERAELARWVTLFKAVRALVGTGTLVHGDHPDPNLLVTGVVAADRSEVVFVVATVGSLRTQSGGPARLPGLDPARRYQVVQVMAESDGPVVDPGGSWLAGVPLALPGAALTRSGLRLPAMAPESAMVLRLLDVADLSEGGLTA